MKNKNVIVSVVVTATLLVVLESLSLSLLLSDASKRKAEIIAMVSSPQQAKKNF